MATEILTKKVTTEENFPQLDIFTIDRPSTGKTVELQWLNPRGLQPHPKNKIARRVEYQLGHILIGAFTMDEPSPDGGYIIYLSGTSMAKAIGMPGKSSSPNKLSRQLKGNLPDGFAPIRARFRNSTGGSCNVNLWPIKDANVYFSYQASKGNDLAIDLCKSAGISEFYPINKKVDKTVCYVNYLMQAGCYLKIGLSTESTVKSRLKALQGANPVEIILLAVKQGGIKEERDMHKQFSSLRVRGEWFKDHPSIRAAFGLRALPPSAPSPLPPAPIATPVQQDFLTLPNWP